MMVPEQQDRLAQAALLEAHARAVALAALSGVAAAREPRPDRAVARARVAAAARQQSASAER